MTTIALILSALLTLGIAGLGAYIFWFIKDTDIEHDKPVMFAQAASLGIVFVGLVQFFIDVLTYFG